MYTALQIAHYVIDFCYSRNKPISNLELQKIMYFLQVFYMRSNKGTPLISDNFYAWKYGPVIPSVYTIYSGYGGGVIKNNYNCSEIDPRIASFIAPYILSLKEIGPWGLVDIAHRAGGSWFRIYKEGMGNGDIIPMHLIATDDIEL